jgi:hypothetical protein
VQITAFIHSYSETGLNSLFFRDHFLNKNKLSYQFQENKSAVLNITRKSSRKELPSKSVLNSMRSKSERSKTVFLIVPFKCGRDGDKKENSDYLPPSLLSIRS